MKRWIIEYFDIDTMENDVMAIVSHTHETALGWFKFWYSWDDFCFPVMGIREDGVRSDGSIGGG